MEHLTDIELARYISTHDTDPVRIRLSKIIEELTDGLLKELEDQGMDLVSRKFDNTYSPSEYIAFLESELNYYHNELDQKYKELSELEQMTVLDFMASVRYQITEVTARCDRMYKENRELQLAHDKMKDKLSMWAKLNGQV